MNLRNNQITLEELMQNPKSKAVLQRRFGNLLNHPMVGMARKMSLARLAEMAKQKLPQSTIDDTIRELEAL
ncbi:MAG: hypothetical protein R3Y07_06765 [Eubacteriales bacterium]